MNSHIHEVGKDEALPEGAIRVALSRPIQAPPPNGQTGMRTLESLTFREPNAEDIELAGCPVSFDFGARNKETVIFDERKMNAMLAQLSGLPLAFIRKMNARDWQNCAWSIAPFFVPGARA